MISLMSAVMVVQAALIYQVQHETSIASMCQILALTSRPDAPSCILIHFLKETAGIGAAAMLFIFQGAFTIGFQATVWVYPSEILPLRLRQRGSSISTGANWICNFLIVYITPPAIRDIGWKTYIIFAVLNAVWVPIMVGLNHSYSSHWVSHYLGLTDKTFSTCSTPKQKAWRWRM